MLLEGMRRSLVLTPVCFCAFGVFGCTSIRRDSDASSVPPPAHLYAAAPPPTTGPAAQPPIGALGLPLGTVAEIRATVVPGSSLGDKGHQGVYLLRVTHVNGRELPDPPLIEFGVPAYLRKGLARTPFELYEMKYHREAPELDDKQTARLEQGYVGKEFHLTAYETGRYSGIPQNMPRDIPLWQDRGFHFSTSLAVVAERD